MAEVNSTEIKYPGILKKKTDSRIFAPAEKATYIVLHVLQKAIEPLVDLKLQPVSPCLGLAENTITTPPVALFALCVCLQWLIYITHKQMFVHSSC